MQLQHSPKIAPCMYEEHWERVLWKRKPYPDNYVPKSFLSSLTRNPNFKPYTYWTLVSASWSISQHLGAIFIFLAVFVRLKERYLDPRILVWLTALSFILGYLVWDFLLAKQDKESRGVSRTKTVKSSILVFLALIGLSPILRTLTAATSSDSIWALSACLFILNVLLADFSSLEPGKQPRESLTSVLSINAAISASVVLASRLADDISVFALMLFSIQTFALFPTLRRRLQVLPAPIAFPLTAALLVLSITLTAPLSITVASVYSAVFIFVTFLAPGILVWAQRYKNEIRGTWDPAIPKLNAPPSRHRVPIS